MDYNKLCIHCMRETTVQAGEACPHCGRAVGVAPELTHQLKPLTILRGKYLIGDVLGEGGFGITYIGLDLNLEIRVAVKEFYPNGYATRESAGTSSLTIYSGGQEETVRKWRENFLKEAKSLAKCAHMSGVVGVRDYFQENNTAYLVMEYVEGVTLKEYQRQRGGRIAAAELLPAMEPVFKALGEVHRQGLIHRDISPDNIMLLSGRQMKLLDFGAAREYEADEKSLSVMLKPGYAPEEQYRSRGNQGPWSDIYALAGTIYKCLTGITPPEALERLRQDELVRPNEGGAGLSAGQENALIKALAVRAEDRYQTVEAFRQDLYADAAKPKTVSAAPSAEAATGSLPAAEAPQTGQAGLASDRRKKEISYGILALLGGAAAAVIVLGLTDRTPQRETAPTTVVQTTQEVQLTEEQEPLAEDSADDSADANVSLPLPADAAEAEQPDADEETEEDDTAIHRYELITADLSWSEAYWDCIDRGGYLAHIDSQEEFDTVTQMIRSEEKKKYIFWLGAARRKDAEQYFWIDETGDFGKDCINTPAYQSYWLENEPSYTGTDANGVVSDETCLSMLYRSAEDRFCWNDVPNDLLSVADFYAGRIGYICEYEE